MHIQVRAEESQVQYSEYALGFIDISSSVRCKCLSLRHIAKGCPGAYIRDAPGYTNISYGL